MPTYDFSIIRYQISFSEISFLLGVFLRLSVDTRIRFPESILSTSVSRRRPLLFSTEYIEVNSSFIFSKFHSGNHRDYDDFKCDRKMKVKIGMSSIDKPSKRQNRN